MNLINIGTSDYRYAPILSEYPYYYNFTTPTLIVGTPNKRCLAIISNQSYDLYHYRDHGFPITRLVTDHIGPAGGICDPTDVFFTFVHREVYSVEDIQYSILQGLWSLGIQAAISAYPALIPTVLIDNVESIIGSVPMTNGPYNGWYVTYWYIRFDITQYDYSSIYKPSILPCLDSFVGTARRVGGLYEFIPNINKTVFYNKISSALSNYFDLGGVTNRLSSTINFIAKAKKNYLIFTDDSWIYDGVHP